MFATSLLTNAIYGPSPFALRGCVFPLNIFLEVMLGREVQCTSVLKYFLSISETGRYSIKGNCIGNTTLMVWFGVSNVGDGGCRKKDLLFMIYLGVAG